MAAHKKIKITQIRSVIHTLERHKRTIEALGLGRPNYSVIHTDTPQIRGMLNAVRHLVVVEEVKS
jgi:ribosomal protein L30, bacterial/organelle